jgi:hypothetical protein
VVAASASGQDAQVGVGGFGSDVGQAMLDGVEDQVPEVGDGLGKAEMRLRLAQEIQPASSARASGSSAWKIMRSCSLSR